MRNPSLPTPAFLTTGHTMPIRKSAGKTGKEKSKKKKKKGNKKDKEKNKTKSGEDGVGVGGELGLGLANYGSSDSGSDS